MCTVLSVFNVDHWYIGLMHACFLDRGKPAKEARSRKRVEHLIQLHEAERSTAATAEIEELNRTQLRLKMRSNAAAAEIEELDQEAGLKCKKDYENSPMQLYLKDVQANIARDPDFYRRKPAPAHM